MAIGTPTEQYAQALAAQTTTSAFSPASQINTGRMAFLITGAGGGKVVTGVTDTAGNTWAVDRTATSGAAAVSICSCQVTATIGTGDTITVTYSAATSSTHAIWVQEVTGLDTSSALDKVNSTQDSSTTPASGLLGTLSQANEIIWAVMRTNTASTWTKDARFTDATTPSLTSPPNTLEYWIVSSTTSVQANGTLGTSGAWSMAAASYKEGSAASPGDTMIPMGMLGTGRV